jgi:lipoate-protein ligase A
MMWRVIPYAENNAFLNMAIDESVSARVASGASPPTIRFYGWKPCAISIGYFQSLEREVDLNNCKAAGVDIVRRRTGGGAVFHEREVTYSIIGKEELFPKDIIASYREICGCLIDALGLLGISAEFKPINDILVNGKKISGNAQTRRGGVLLQHGTLLYEVDVERMFSLLRVSDEKIKDKMIASARERVTSVREQKNVDMDDVLAALEKGFTQGREYETGELTREELADALGFVESRYRKEEWNRMR